MGIQCRIIRDKAGNVTYVEAPNGNRSQLYDDAKRVMGEEAALDAVLTAYTPTFTEEVKNPKIAAFRRDLIYKINNLPSSVSSVGIQFEGSNMSITPSSLQMLTEDLGNGETLFTFKGDIAPLNNKPLLAPNGNPSNLDIRQWNQVRSPEFMEWSNNWDDVIKDENGEPQVHYHGTPEHGFTEFSSPQGIDFFTPNREIAETYAGFEVGDPNSVYEVFIKSPKTFDPVEEIPSEIEDFINKNWKGILEFSGSGVRFRTKKAAVDNIMNTLRTKGYNWEILEYPPLVDLLKEQGYTGIRTLEQKGNIGIFTNTDIKSATENIGTFDESNPDIRFSVGDSNGNFERWKGNNKLVEGEEVQDVKTGEPVVVRGYHGTTNEFYEFDSSVKGTIEGHLGRVNYFTTDVEDATNNYLANGADLTNRIERETSFLEDNLREEYNDFEESEDFDQFVEDNNITEEELSERNLTRDSVDPAPYLADILATRRLMGGTEKVLDLYIKLNNPVVLGRGINYHDFLDREQFEDYIDEAAEEVADENDVSIEEAKEDFSYEVEARAMESAGYINPLHEALEKAIADNSYDYYNAAEKASMALSDYLFDSEVDLNELERRIREELTFEENENGELSSAQIVSDFFKNLGFDGIILNNVSQRFNMGLKDTTSHVHVFDEYNNQIKLADGSNVEFGSTSDIRYQQDQNTNTPKEKLQGIIDTLFPSDLAKKVNILPEAEFAKRVGEAGGRYQQNMNGFALKDEVVLNERMAGLDTPIHEFGHLWNSYMKENAKDIYYRGLSLIEKEGQEYLDFVSKNQPKLKGEAKLEEALAQAIGDNGRRLAETKSGGLKEWLKSLWETIKDMAGFGDVTPEQLRKMTLNDFTQRAAADLMRGETIEDLMASSPFITGTSVQPTEREHNPSKKIERFEYDSDFTTTLPKKSLKDVIREYSGRVFIVTSDATGTGYDSKGDPIYGGVGFMSIKKNVEDGIGFASLNEETVVKTLPKISGRYGANQKVAVLVMVQNPSATVGNYYGAKFFGRGLKQLKEQNSEQYSAVVDSVEDYISSIKGLRREFRDKRTRGEVVREGTYDAFIDLLRNVDQYSEVEFAEEFVKDTTFDARRKLLQGLLLDKPETRTTSTHRLVTTALRDSGFTQLDFLKEYGDNTLFSEEMYRNDEGGFVAGGFEYTTPASEAEQSSLIQETQAKGITHHQFNGKLPTTGENFFLDGLYPVNDNFASYAKPTSWIDYSKVDRETINGLVREMFPKETHYQPQYREGAESFIPMAERGYTQLRAGMKKSFKENLLESNPEYFEFKEPVVTSSVAKGDGYYPSEREGGRENLIRESNNFVRFSVGDNLTQGKFMGMLMRGQWGMLTAENPNAQELSPEENAKRNEEGREWLESRGYELTPIVGHYGNKENSFFVPNLEPQDAIDFAIKFDQESVATDVGLIYQDGTMEHRKKRDDSMGGTFEDFYSTININGSDFNFAIGYDIGHPQKNESLLVKSKEEIDATQEDRGHIPHLNRDGEGNYLFYHFSSQQRDSIDPSKSGTNDITSSGEASAISMVGGVSMYYTKEKDKESGVGQQGHLVKIPMEKVYDVNADPDGLLPLARKDFEKKYPNQGFDGNKQVAFMTKIANRKGYDMVVAEWKAGAYRAQTTKKMKPDEVRIVEGNTIKKDWTDYSSGRPKFSVGFMQTKDTPEGEQVKLSNVDPKLQGKGLGTEMYKKAAGSLASKGKSLVADGNNKGAEGVWNKLREAQITEPVEVDGQVVERVRLQPDSFDFNGEPSVADVSNYIQSKNYEGQTLSPQEVNEVRNAMLGTDYTNSEELYNTLRRAFLPEGVYSPSETSLVNSGLYSRVEARRLMTDMNTQLKAYEMMHKLKNSDVIPNDAEVDSDYITLEGDYNSLGILNKANPFLNEKEAIDKLGGIKDETVFSNQAEAYDLGFASRKFDELSGMTKLNVTRVDGDNLRTETSLDTLRTQFEETLTSPSSPQLIDSLNYLLDVPNTVWNTEFGSVQNLLEGIEVDAVDIGLDLSNLNEIAYDRTPADVKNLLTSVRNFAVVQNDTTFDLLFDTYVDFFGIEARNNTRTLNLRDEIAGKTLVYTESEANSYELFDKFGLLPVGRNLYQKVNTNKSLDEVYDIIYRSLAVRPSILPATAFKAAYDGRELDTEYLTNPANEEFVKNDIRNYANEASKEIDNSRDYDTDTLRKMVLFSAYFGTQLNNTQPTPSLESESSVISTFPRNANYLQTDFIADFNKSMLKEKIKNSDKYNNFYRNFEVTNKGINLVNSDPISLRNIEPYLTNDIKNHFKIKKDSFLFDEAEVETVNDNIRRMYYSNYPKALSKFKGTYQIDRGTLITSADSQFLRVDEGLFEYVESVGSKNLYGRINTREGDFKSYDSPIEAPTLENTKFNIPKGVRADKKINNLYTKSEGENITNEIDNC